jgi:hypothetical protein
MEISGHWRSCPWKRSPAKRISPCNNAIRVSDLSRPTKNSRRLDNDGYPHSNPRAQGTQPRLTVLLAHLSMLAAHDQGVHVRSALRSSIRRDKPLWIQGKWIEFERKMNTTPIVCFANTLIIACN